ncbi:2-octaprenyl-6-methoxyphenyl hydroxylase [Halopseudomonas oceani]|uniref:2-octaprenyl-6-methoxyphenyl hydroxylase n=1 Tax=Halopseudomonas oceani TaxID=1708783 RepID=A0A2P4ETV3_9GAMM|nr:2-octaprenyl-6-methoxyphenyl hydroxylase [Halopseudomonas oceani]POB02721.1 2-octaprenyl-6-methoxyphenyl hydroxylase [Halopseudomonas oceani]GGE51664.1 2-octaprenyl-6-methoxyphenyl hydroxylase [Halopseudomonas oceani]
MSRQISIVGGGMVGASLALALQPHTTRCGWRINLIEAQPPADGHAQPSFDARSTALSHGSRLLFEQLGIWHELAGRVEPIRQIHVSDRGHPGVTRLSAEKERVPALGYVVENAVLGQVLLAALDPAVVRWQAPARVVRAEPARSGWLMQVEEHGQVHEQATDLLVVADGGRSGLLEQLGIHRQVRPYGQTAIIANITSSQGHDGVAYERFTRSGPLALLPMSGGRSALVWTQPEAQADEVMACSDAAFLEALQDAFGFRMGALKRVGQRHAYPLSLIEAEEQVRSGLVVLGNAAHSLHPIAGQGFNLSLRDAVALADTLIGADANQSPGDLALLNRYFSSQRQDQQQTIAFSDWLTRLFSNRRPVLAAGRNLGLLGMDIVAPLKSVFARQAMGLKG